MSRPRSLRAKLLAAVLLYVALLGAVGLIGLYAAQASLGGMHVAVEHHVRELSLLSQISADVGLIRSTSLLHILSTSELERAAYEAQITQWEANVAARLEELTRTQASFDDQEDAKTVDAFRSAWREFLRVQDEQVLPLSRADRDQEALSVARPDGPLDQAYQTAMLRLAALQATLPTESTERLDLAQRDFARNRNVLLAVVALAALVGIASGLAYTARLAAAVQTLAWAAGRVAAGDLAERVRLRTGDELEALGTSFNVMTANLQRMTEQLNSQLRQLGATNGALETEIAERRRTEVALRESEERLRLALSAGQMCTWEWDLGANTVVTSEPAPARADQPGPARLELSGVLEGVHPGDRARVEQAFAEVRAGRRDELDVDYRVADAEGQVCWRAAKGRVRRAADGRPAKVVGVLLDVTDQKQAEEKRIALVREQAARAQAEEALRLHDQFLVVAAHELKTPITSLLASAQLIARQVDRGAVLDPARLKDRVRTIDRQADKLGRLVTQLVDVGRLEAGDLSLDRTETDVTALVQGVVDAVQMQSPRHALVIRAPGRVGALVDPLRMEQVVTNLLDNAIKFSPGGGTVEVEVSTPDAATVRLAVSDPGIGIPPDRRGRIFERFYQAHTDDHRSGMGLGLYLSRQIVERHGGHIEAEFPPQGGTRLVVTLPSGRVAGGGPAEAAA